MIAEKFAIVRWTYDTAGDGGRPEFHGRPPVTAGLIVVGSDDQRPEGIGYVYAFDCHSLSLRWKRRAATGVMTDVAGCDGTAYVVTLDDELLALDLDTGVVRWRFASGASNPHYFPSSTPVIVGDRVIFGGFDGTVRALSTRSGSVLWQRD
jgi:outer membrane protein assembly factor BamB